MPVPPRVVSAHNHLSWWKRMAAARREAARVARLMRQGAR